MATITQQIGSKVRTRAQFSQWPVMGERGVLSSFGRDGSILSYMPLTER